MAREGVLARAPLADPSSLFRGLKLLDLFDDCAECDRLADPSSLFRGLKPQAPEHPREAVRELADPSSLFRGLKPTSHHLVSSVGLFARGPLLAIQRTETSI